MEDIQVKNKKQRDRMLSHLSEDENFEIDDRLWKVEKLKKPRDIRGYININLELSRIGQFFRYLLVILSIFLFVFLYLGVNNNILYDLGQIKNAGFNLFNITIMNKEYKIDPAELKQGTMVYFKDSKEPLPVFVTKNLLQLGEVQRRSDLFIEVKYRPDGHYEDVVITVPVYNVLYIKNDNKIK